MGEAYEWATARCLNGEFEVQMDDPVGSSLARAFERLGFTRDRAWNKTWVTLCFVFH